jgi:hypothetical protein
MDTAEKVEAMFDPISYDKGGSVLRMLRAYLNRVSDPKPLLRRSLSQARLSAAAKRLLVFDPGIIGGGYPHHMPWLLHRFLNLSWMQRAEIHIHS